MVKERSWRSQARALREALIEMTDIVLSNVAMLSEIPAPTYREQAKAKFLTERFSENQLDDCSTDDIGNAFGVLTSAKGGTGTGGGEREGRGSDGRNGGRKTKSEGRNGGSKAKSEGGVWQNSPDRVRNVLVMAHLDTNFSEEVDHTVRFEHDRVCGVGVSDNSVGVAMIASLPTILERLGIHLRANLILMGTVHGLGSGNIAGIRSFLDNTSLKIDNAICIEGNTLGRLSVSSQSMFRGEIRYRTSERGGSIYDRAQNAVMCLNLITNRMLELRLPRKPLTNVVINAIRCGRSFNAIPVAGTIRFEINSEAEEVVVELAKAMQNICDEVSARGEADITLDTIATRRAGGLSFSHPLAETARGILRALEVEPRFQYSASELSACIDHHIPAVTIGITTSVNTNTVDEQVDIAPIPTGIAQLVQLLLAIDNGECDGSV